MQTALKIAQFISHFILSIAWHGEAKVVLAQRCERHLLHNIFVGVGGHLDFLLLGLNGLNVVQHGGGLKEAIISKVKQNVTFVCSNSGLF